MMLEGLNQRPIEKILDFLVEHKFNAMRLLFNMQDWRDDSPIPQDHFSAFLNPDFVGLNYRGMLREVVRKAADKGILVMLACHRIRRFYSDGIHAEWPSGWDGWWYDNKMQLAGLLAWFGVCCCSAGAQVVHRLRGLHRWAVAV